jgi:hypothetical protein
MKPLLLVVVIFLMADICQGQVYNKDKVCGTDTIHISYRDLKTGNRVNYKAFTCTKASKPGIRLNFGLSSFAYSDETKKWMGNHNAGVLGLSFVYGKFDFGVNVKLTTISPVSKLAINSDTLTTEAKVNPIKFDFYTGYSIDLKNNFSIEPHLGVTENLFVVINEKELNQSFDIPTIYGLNTGITLNKYFKLKDFQFISVFFTYNYGFTNFKKINPNLGRGYSEWSFGLSYKVFTKRSFYERLD